MKNIKINITGIQINTTNNIAKQINGEHSEISKFQTWLWQLIKTLFKCLFTLSC